MRLSRDVLLQSNGCMTIEGTIRNGKEVVEIALHSRIVG